MSIGARKAAMGYKKIWTGWSAIGRVRLLVFGRSGGECSVRSDRWEMLLPRRLWDRNWPMLFLVGLLWVVRYWHSWGFGFYEDDLTHLPTAAAMTFNQAVRYAFDVSRILQLHGGGHPIHYSFIYLLTNIGWRLGEFHALYLIGFSIEALNICLFFLLMRRIQSWRLGLVAGVAYVLYSADTTQTYLTLALGLHPGITIFLVAAHAYMSNKKWLSYVLAPLMLLTYETIYPVFFALPLLTGVAVPQRRRDFVNHIAFAGGILTLFAVWRLFVGDDRISGLGLKDAIIIPVTHMVEGPIVSLGTYLYRCVQTLRSLDLEVALISALGIAGFAWLLSSVDLGASALSRDKLFEAIAQIRQRAGWRRALAEAYARLPGETSSLVKSAFAGAVMLVLAYPLTFTVRAYAISGRDTRVHAAGVLGAAVLVGSVALILLHVANAVGRRRMVTLGLATWLGLLAGFGFVIQRDYRLAWTYQRQFWTSLVQLIPDVSEGDSILVEPQGLLDTRQIGANYWNLPVVLGQIYDFPKDWHDPVWVYRLTESWQQGILGRDGELTLNAATAFAPPDTFRDVDPSSAILIETENGNLRRKSGPMEIGGSQVTFKETQVQGQPPYPPGFLYRYLIQQTDSKGKPID